MLVSEVGLLILLMVSMIGKGNSFNKPNRN